MTFYTDDSIDMFYVPATNSWLLMLNAKPVKDAKRKATLENFVSKNSVPWERP